MPVSFPVPEPRVMPRFGLLSTRQEAFCRHFVACGNAAEAARRAGYACHSAWNIDPLSGVIGVQN